MNKLFTYLWTWTSRMIQSSKYSKNDEDSGIDDNEMLDPAIDVEDIDKTKQYFKSCRQCELACPVGS